MRALLLPTLILTACLAGCAGRAEMSGATKTSVKTLATSAHVIREGSLTVCEQARQINFLLLRLQQDAGIPADEAVPTANARMELIERVCTKTEATIEAILPLVQELCDMVLGPSHKQCVALGEPPVTAEPEQSEADDAGLPESDETELPEVDDDAAK